MKTLTIIPAKAGSTRLPKKNIRPLAGKPLLVRTIETAFASGICGKIMVSTESEEVAELGARAGAEVPFMRPAHLAKDPYGISDVCLHVLDQYEEAGERFDKLIILLPTSPFCTSEDVVEADRVFARSEATALFSVMEMGHVFNALEPTGEPDMMAFRFPDMIRRKNNEIPKLYRPNGAITILDVPAFREAGTYIQSPMCTYRMPWERSIDIDTEADFAFAEFMIERG